jgi:uncharacterized membrane protein
MDMLFGWIVSHPIAYPALEVAHILGIALLVGNLVLVETRVWGWHTSVPLEAVARPALTISLAGFALTALTGLAMFASQPEELISNRWFVAKVALVMTAGLNAAAFHARGGLKRLDGWARAQTALSLGLWIAVMICGRWIAYA